ncbi:FixH family protein [Noviherbaspirillum aerium]|uniref:FixH family protein n=1 Tax=Noviherbaspirillum aerium TaxID=2588497 RepID=UPI00124ED90C|nr:FixH family protein [Noviherbaspirillum aerium]
MQSKHSRRPAPARTAASATSAAPWYAHRWPWLLMLGPIIVVIAGIHTTWIAFTRQDALVVDDYYKQGKAINQDLSRDRVAASMKLQATMRYDASSGQLLGSVRSLGQPVGGPLTIKLVHSTQPQKDVLLQVRPDAEGNFSAALPMLDRARWQVSLEGAERNWRVHDVWDWPVQRSVSLTAYHAD